MLINVDLAPGVYANGTNRQAKNRWRLSNLVRWPDGPNLQPVGGWASRVTSGALSGMARAAVPWMDNTSTRWLGIGTHTGLYVQSASGAISDVTPVGFTPGYPDATTGGGFGSGVYGASTYGTPRVSIQNTTPASVWNLDTWGQYLVGCMQPEGNLYIWELDTAQPAQVIANAPDQCVGLAVTDERFIFALRERNVAWCAKGDETDWNPTSLNEAGDLDIDTSGQIVCGKSITGGTLIFTTADVWEAKYQGLPTVYGFYKAGSDCGVISKQAPVVLDSRCVWMGNDQFYIYNGFVQSLPCDVADYVFSNINRQQISKVTGWHNSGFGEVWWCYPSGSSNENDRYVVWNYQRNIWYFGTLSRTCGVVSGVFQYPIAIDADGGIWEHENGWNWSGATPYAQSGPFEWPGPMGGSDKRTLVRGFVGDEAVQGQSQVTFYGREWPNADATTFGPYTITTAPVDVLFSTRNLEMRIDVTTAADARVGIYQMDVVPVGKR
jgi:hypothetical protein